jgi:hypothetical protein
MRPLGKMRAHRRAIAALAAVLALASCESLEHMFGTERPKVEVAPPPPPPPAPPPKPAPPATVDGPRPLPNVSSVPSDKPREPVDFERLIGRSEEEAVGMIGAPEETIDQAPATVWRYRTPDCVLDVFFYADMATEKRKALAYEVRPAIGKKVTQKVCVDRLRTLLAKR